MFAVLRFLDEPPTPLNTLAAGTHPAGASDDFFKTMGRGVCAALAACLSPLCRARCAARG